MVIYVPEELPCWMLSGDGPVIAGRTALTTIWHWVELGEQVCGPPFCGETVTLSAPWAGIVANKLSGIRARITELEAMETRGKLSGPVPVIEAPFTATVLVEIKFVPVI